MQPFCCGQATTTRCLFLTAIISALCLVSGAVSAVAFTDVDRAYRSAAPDSESCGALKANPKALQASENDEKAALADLWWNCALQRHENPPAPGAASIASLTKRQIHEPSAFNLAFVEFGEDGRELFPSQRNWLFEHLERQSQNYVVVFVHGWRNDARRGNENLKSFRTLLSYAKSALEHRCVEAQRYCNATLTGVFLGWRGEVLEDDDGGTLSDILAAPTFFTRKPTSDVVAGGVARFLRDMGRTLDTRNAKADNDFMRDHMLAIGHSLGGNILITGLGPDILSSVRSVEAGKTMRSPVGDLIVMLNPAAEAAKWTDIQDAVAQRQPNLFSPVQRPLVVSLTVACHYSDEELREDPTLNSISCDTITGTVFPAYKIATGNFFRESRSTLGNLDPEGDATTHAGHGTTHEFDINGSLNKKSEYNLASDVNYSQCRIGDGWMTDAKERADGRERWDAGYKTKVDADDERFAVDPVNDSVDLNVPDAQLDTDQLAEKTKHGLRVNAQFRRGIYRGNGPAITSGDDPFWNARAIESVARDHTRVFSPLTWCAMHQIVLDDVAGKPLYSKDKIWK